MQTKLIALLIALWAGPAVASVTVPDSGGLETKDSLVVLNDIATAAQLDSAIYCYYEDLLELSRDVYALSDLELNDSIPAFTSATYQQRLALLDAQTPFDLSYNTTIEAFIHLYVSRKRQLSAKCLGRSDLYFPMFEEMLDRYNLPIELKYLAVVESALDPKIKSRAGATGLWQFMYGTGKVFGLKTDSYVDERCDPVASTEAACKYLSHLYKMFGDWNLALAAYNCGEGRVTKAIRRAGGKMDYWAIYPYLPAETRGYVPAFIAVNYMFAYAKEHKIAAIPAPFHAWEVDSIHISQPMSFKQIATLLQCDEETIQRLNPVYKMNYIPAYGNHNVVYLPKEKINLWYANLGTIEQHVAAQTTEAAPKPAATSSEATSAPSATTYIVRSGDYLGKIASRYGCTVSQIQKWNNLRGTSISPGQKLKIYSKTAATTAQVQPSVNKTTDSTASHYVIRSGDTLWNIAKSHGVSVANLRDWNGGLQTIRPGQKIRVTNPG